MRIPNYEDYEIDEKGNVYSYKMNRVKKLKIRLSHDGYARVALSNKNGRRDFFVHRLVMLCFGSEQTKETINHIDGNKLNNDIANLEWATREENMKHAYRLGLKKPMRGVLQGNSVLTVEEVIEIRNTHKPRSKDFGTIALSKKYNVSISTITKCVGRRSYKNV